MLYVLCVLLAHGISAFVTLLPCVCVRKWWRQSYLSGCEVILCVLWFTTPVAFKAVLLQLRLRVVVMILFGLCMILLWLVDVDSCASFQFLSLGIMPMQVCLTAFLHHHMPDSISHK